MPEPLKQNELESFQDQCYYYRKTTILKAVKMDKAFTVKTKEGIMTGKPGDYLAFGVQWEPYIIDATIFKKSYELFSAKCQSCGMESCSQEDFTMHHIETGH